MPRTFFLVAICLALSGAVMFAAVGAAIRSMTFWHGVDGIKDWDELCEIENCSEFPPLYMTYEVDGALYFFPASTHPPDPSSNFVPTFFGVLPTGHRRDESRYRRSIQVGRTCCTGWGPLDFDLYLETRDDHTISRGFGRINSGTDTIRFGRGVLAKLPEYYGIDTTHPSGALRDFRFYLHSRDRRSDDFLLNSRLRLHRQQEINVSQRTGTLDSIVMVNSASDLPNAGLLSFNDAFWIVADRREVDTGPYLRGLAVVSKSPLLHGRHVYGSCSYASCRFYSLWFSGDVENEEPLMMVEMIGDDIDVLSNRSCAGTLGDPACDPDRVSLSNIRLRFEVVEQVIAALRTPRPALHD
ncbi:hypothetical protein L0666_01295 [Octadecabacter sp. CECT 8868]|uniref:hypothetical protein n=1 Tax=Octadecabacter algicola TaxID=2909342 RepID=UPI001F3B9D08|nr:hypothetical protein [Octadecabacter algicola]MCF2903611.1 hypothetical protein [Octadecabacter algicola]